MTKMPLGAKLTQNDSKVIFGMDSDMELRQILIQQIEKTQTIFKD